MLFYFTVRLLLLLFRFGTADIDTCIHISIWAYICVCDMQIWFSLFRYFDRFCSVPCTWLTTHIYNIGRPAIKIKQNRCMYVDIDVNANNFMSISYIKFMRQIILRIQMVFVSQMANNCVKHTRSIQTEISFNIQTKLWI